jgi:hypothetical protein
MTFEWRNGFGNHFGNGTAESDSPPFLVVKT